jgi:hypothetical protein
LPSKTLLRSAVLGVAAGAVPLLLLRNFTVDDALIPARYAHHLAVGLGYRFNRTGPSTDGVTPLGWAHLLAPFAGQGPLAALRAARVIGAAAFLAACAWLGVAVDRASRHPARAAALLLVLVSAPLGAWAASGLETGLAIALATAAAVAPARPEWSRAGGLLAGLVAWLRPEMIAYAIVLGAGRARLAHRHKWLPVALSILPFALVVALRLVFFGRPAPLAVWAKPSDLAHGLAYAGACLLLTGGPLAVVAPRAYGSLSTWPRVLLAGALVHFMVVALVGGDWMPLSRLVAPVLPSLALVFAHELPNPPSDGPSPSRTFAPRALLPFARLAIGLSGELFAAWRVGPSAARVLPDRLALIEAARAPLAGARCVAAVDAGWVGAATEADVLDLAGVTDPEVASFPGGHTSKRVGTSTLTQRGADRIVLQLSSRAGQGPFVFARIVEERLAAEPSVARDFTIVWRSPSGLPVRYAVMSRNPVTEPPYPSTDPSE